MSEAAATPQPNAGAPTDERPTTKPSADDYLALKIADLDLKGIGNLRELDKDSLAELTRDVKQHGVLEPVLVRESGGKFQLVAGFRRVAASKAAGLTHVPGRILELSDAEIQEVQLVENIQREGLAPLEEARAFQRYLEVTKRTQQQLGDRIGKSQSYVANRVRLLGLPVPVQKMVDAGDLSSSHAEVLLKLPASEAEIAVETAKNVVKQSVPVAELNRVVTRHLEEVAQEKKVAEKATKSNFPKCPTCGKPPTQEDNPGFVSHGDYSPAHLWELTTGKTELQRRQEEEARWRERNSRSRAPKARPKPVDCRESALVRSSHDPAAIINALLKDAGPEAIYLLEYTGHAGHGVTGAVLRVGFSKRPLGDVHLVARPVKYSTGERTQFVVQDTKGDERRASKSKVQAWERKALPALKLKPSKSREFDAKQLLGTAAMVCNRLQKIREDHELLELARGAEAKGKRRAAVLDYIDTALLGRGHDSFGSVYDRRL
jgi:ParB family chromosome partitioning protein